VVNINRRQQEDGEEGAWNSEAGDEAQEQGEILAHEPDGLLHQPKHTHPLKPAQTTTLIVHPPNSSRRAEERYVTNSTSVNSLSRSNLLSANLCHLPAECTDLATHAKSATELSYTSLQGSAKVSKRERWWISGNVQGGSAVVWL